MSDISDCYDCLEREMLQEFYRHLRSFQQMKYLHWNMRDSNYGFQAIEHRFRVLGGSNDELHVVDDNKKIDLARVLIDIYGLSYIGHPRLEKLPKKNDISQLDFLTGAKEAKAFEDKQFVDLHRSTLRKVDVIANIAGRAHGRSLKTNTGLWDLHGGRPIQIINWIVEHPGWGFVGAILIIGLIIAFIALSQ